MDISLTGAYQNMNYPFGGSGFGLTGSTGQVSGTADPEEVGKIERNPGESEIKAPGRKSSPAECETCKERKYQDGSDEMVSFKAAAHLSPTSAPAAVRAHENEHVSNAYKKAAKENGKVLRASVSIKMAICPECGRSYVAGGQTNTCIKFPKDDNPYNKNLRSLMDEATKGANFSLAV